MQIHEIARRKTNEGILKGVATNIAKGAVNTVKPVVNYAVDQAKGVAKLPLNTAEYFANKILDTAGVPAAQQGRYSKYGQIAAGQNKGTASIAKAENLQRKLLNAIRTRDSGKFARSVRRTNADT